MNWCQSGSSRPRKGQELSNELRERSRSDTSALSEASKEVVKVMKVDRQGVGLDDVASFIAGILHQSPEKERALGGAFVEQKKVQQRGLIWLEFEEVG